MKLKKFAPGVVGAMIAGILAVTAAPSAAASDCYAWSCEGLDPSTTSCQYDAMTIGAMDVQGAGMLELRWSPSCNASWGRFSSYWLYDITNSVAGLGISYARVTAWNPGGLSQDGIGQIISGYGGASWWTAMVTGSTTSCTGVEIFFQDNMTTNLGTGMKSDGWVWGPCVA